MYIPAFKKDKPLGEYHDSEVIAGGNERILLVDDEKSVLRIEQVILEKRGYTIALKTSSIDALESVKATPDAYDLVISDMAMPNMTGDQLAIKLLKIKPTLPIIICTGFSEKLSLEQLESIGIKALLMKPIIKSKLAATVRNVLDKAQKKVKNN